MRRVLSCVVSAAVVLAGVVVLAAPAAAAAAAGDTYTALPVQARLVDTRTGAAGNHKGAVSGGHGILPTLGGHGGVPVDAVAVAATISAVSPTANGGIVGYIGSRPGVTNVQFTKGHAVTDTAILRLSGGRLYLFNTAASGTVQIVVDVSGYYSDGSVSTPDPGAFHSVTPSRVVNTQTGADGNHKGALPAGHGIAPAIGGHGGVPADAGAAAVTITVINPTKAGTIIAYRPDEPKQSFALVHFAAGQRVSAFAVLRLSGGQVDIVNTSAGTVHVLVDVAGYYDIGFAQSANTFQTLVQTRALSSSIGANANLAVATAGVGGVPLSRVAAVLVTLHVAAPAKSGGFQAWQYGHARPSSTTVLQFAAEQTTSNVVLVPVSADGKFYVHNSSSGSATVVVDIDGYVAPVAVTYPTATSTARYIRNLSPADDDANRATMSAEGSADVANTFVLLDIGAQLNDKSGVQLSSTSTNLSYEHLVTALAAYVSAYSGAGGKGVIAIGTNNDAAEWTKYPGSSRGADWWVKVVNPIRIAAPDGVTIEGADDIEPGFGTHKVTDAQAWEAGFLQNADARLVFNGSADGCPKTWIPNATCEYGWTEAQLYGLASGNRTQALPQIYFGYMATQWAEIDKTGRGGVDFLGVLTENAENPDTLTPTQGWTALVRGQTSVVVRAIGGVIADIHA